MAKDSRRVRIQCPECNALIVSAPEGDLPKGDLVCPNCDAVVAAPTQVDKFVEDVRSAIEERFGSTKRPDRSD